MTPLADSVSTTVALPDACAATPTMGAAIAAALTFKCSMTPCLPRLMVGASASGAIGVSGTGEVAVGEPRRKISKAAHVFLKQH